MFGRLAKSKIGIVSLEYIKPLDEIETHMAAHRSFIDKYIKSGKFLCAGKKVPRTGGVILCFAESAEEIEGIMKDDPFVSLGLAEHTITLVEPTTFASMTSFF